MPNRRAEAISIGLWWAAPTIVLWGGGQIRHAPAALTACAASAALLISLGEAAHWLRRRIRERRAAHTPRTR
ncbi:hypothetical protein ACIA8F_19800 [Streptomyces sp. NPDC051563]|uniref:hypothetical protein n=1 Tax=Streptomyces sp. NPDC051563 TaxID=3365659 RepID=UPI0037A8D04A